MKSTQKITKAMKMVAASKLRRAQERAASARPYAERMERVIATLALSIKEKENAPALMVGRASDKKHLIVVISSDRGLCGGFNTSVVRAVRNRMEQLKASGKEVKLLLVGKKSYDQLKHGYKNAIIDRMGEAGKKQVEYTDAAQVGARVLSLFESGEVDVCSVVYNKFKSAISQIVTFQQLIPLDINALSEKIQSAPTKGPEAVYDYEPSEAAVLSDLLPLNISVQIFHALLESSASEQGARMTAMDNATRNAGEMIKKLTLEYNRNRQATITKELIEIISGAEAI